jgi:hypothetical protein
MTLCWREFGEISASQTLQMLIGLIVAVSNQQWLASDAERLWQLVSLEISLFSLGMAISLRFLREAPSI